METWNVYMTEREICKHGKFPGKVLMCVRPTWDSLEERLRDVLANVRDSGDLIDLIDSERITVWEYIYLMQQSLIEVGTYAAGKQPIMLKKDVMSWLARYRPQFSRFEAGDSVMITELYPNVGRSGVYTKGKWYATSVIEGNDGKYVFAYRLSVYSEDFAELVNRGHALPDWHASGYTKEKPYNVCISDILVSREQQSSGWRIAGYE